MALPTLRVEGDEPGRRLVLADPAPPGPSRTMAIAICVFALSAGLTVFWREVFLVAYASGGLVLGLAIRRSRVVTGVVVDRSSRRMEVTTLGLVAGRSTSTYDLASKRGLRIAVFLPVPTLGGHPTAPAWLKVTRVYGTRSSSSRYPDRFSVEGVVDRATAEDLARRLALAAGFGYERLVVDGPSHVDWFFGPEPGEGLASVPFPGPHRETRDQPSAPAAPPPTPLEHTAPFDPMSFKSAFRVATWLPGQEVRFVRPFRFAAVGCLPGVALALAGPAAFVVMSRFTELSLADRTLLSIFCGVFGIIFAGVAAFAVSESLPRTVVFDWGERSLEIASLFTRQTHAFSAIRAVGMMSHRTQGGGRSANRLVYECRVSVFLGATGGPARRLALLSTNGAYPDFESPYRAALPLVTELARALGVARDVGNYAGVGSRPSPGR